MLKDVEKFISDSPSKTPPMTVQVIDSKGKNTYTYDAPDGFQLDRYVQSIFPDADLMVSGTHSELVVSVIIPGDNDIYQIHHGKFERPLPKTNIRVTRE